MSAFDEGTFDRFHLMVARQAAAEAAWLTGAGGREPSGAMASRERLRRRTRTRPRKRPPKPPRRMRLRRGERGRRLGDPGPAHVPGRAGGPVAGQAGR